MDQQQHFMDPNEAIQQFCSVTNSSPEQARFYLESSAWQLETALQNFFEADPAPVHSQLNEVEEDEEEEHPHNDPQQAFTAPPFRAAAPPFAPPNPASSPLSGAGGTPSSRSNKPSKEKKSTSGRGGVKTLSDLNRRSDSESDDDNPQEYYTGGEKSGMLVQDPQKGHRDVDAIFDQARRMGAMEGPLEPTRTPSSSRSSFTGVGRTLTGEPTQQGSAGEATGTTPQVQLDPVVRTITFWRNGFTVDDGPLRRLDDPANAQFLTSIGKSECPKELEPADRGTPVHVNLVKKDEDWNPPPEPKHAPFHGVGRTLGSSSTAEAENVPSASTSSSQPLQGLTVNNSQPVTSIQLRLSDGTRLVARFNHHHTVADIRGFIDAARPGYLRNYQLQIMGFPPKVLTDLSETIEAAGLINAVVIQKS